MAEGMQKCVVKEFLTGGERAVALAGSVSLSGSQGTLSIAFHTPVLFISVELKE